MKQLPIPLGGLSDKYSIIENGQIYSHIKKKWLKGSLNSSGYTQYYLNGKWYFAHRLVYITFIGPIIHEINHKDRNKSNNHKNNLEDITHKENIRKARTQNPWNSGRKPGFSHDDDTKKKMAEAKMRRVDIYQDNKLVIIVESIDAATRHLRTYRKKVYRALISSNVVAFPDGRFQLFYHDGKASPVVPDIKIPSCPLERIPLLVISDQPSKLMKIAKHIEISTEGYRVKFWSKDIGGFFEKWFQSRQAILKYFNLSDDFPK